MKKVILWDKTYLFVDNEQVPLLEAKLNGTAKFWLKHSMGRDLLDPKIVVRITDAGNEAPTIQEDHRIERAKETPEETAKIEATKARIRQMWRDRKKLAQEKSVRKEPVA